MQISRRQIEQYLKEKGSTEICPFCSKDNWFAPTAEDDPEDDPLAPLTPCFAELNLWSIQPGEDGKPEKKVSWIARAIPLTCMNCGYMRLQNMIPLQTWLDGASDDAE